MHLLQAFQNLLTNSRVNKILSIVLIRVLKKSRTIGLINWRLLRGSNYRLYSTSCLFLEN